MQVSYYFVGGLLSEVLVLNSIYCLLLYCARLRKTKSSRCLVRYLIVAVVLLAAGFGRAFVDVGLIYGVPTHVTASALQLVVLLFEIRT